MIPVDGFFCFHIMIMRGVKPITIEVLIFSFLIDTREQMNHCLDIARDFSTYIGSNSIVHPSNFVNVDNNLLC